jgi:hypothetical protein
MIRGSATTVVMFEEQSVEVTNLFKSNHVRGGGVGDVDPQLKKEHQAEPTINEFGSKPAKFSGRRRIA